MSSNPSVYIFNASPTTVNVMVNNGTSFQVAGFSTSGSTAFQPVLNSTGATWSTGVPAGNVFGTNTVNNPNTVDITPTNNTTPAAFQISFPQNTQIFSLEIYIFWASNTQAGYVLLNNGQVIAEDFVSLLTSPSAATSSRSRR